MVDSRQAPSGNSETEDLGSRYETLAASIMEIERVWQEDGLTDAVVAQVDPVIQPVYTRLALDNRRPLSFRAHTVESILARTRQLVTGTQLVVRAQVEHPSRLAAPSETTETLTFPALQLIVDTAEGPMAFSFSRVFEVRFWGIDIRPLDKDVRLRCQEFVWRKLVAGLTSDLTSLRNIEERFSKRDINPVMEILPDRRAEAFERLVVDILTEMGIRARLAPLDEDFLEKTDLRVHVPGLGRRRGARVQVTLMTDTDRLRDKFAKIRSSDEFVLLSPRVLAEALCAPQAGSFLDVEEANAALSILGIKRNSVDLAAQSLRSLFVNALQRPREDARGPVALIPPPIRRLISRFVVLEAKRSTRTLRAHESERGRNQETNNANGDD